MPCEPLRVVAIAAGAMLVGIAQVIGTAQGAAAPAAAELAYRNGTIYTVDAHDTVRQAVAVRDGRIVYVGSDSGLAPHVDGRTRVIDLHGRMLMPGLVDGHMHPLEGGTSLRKCNLHYAQLTVVQFQAKIQQCLDDSRAREPDGWLEVVAWFQEGMLPAGMVTSRATLDALKTRRPVLVRSSFGHSTLANSRAVHLAGIDAKTADPLGGKINRDASGEPTGLLDDAAQDLAAAKVPAPTADEDYQAAKLALEALRQQGVTSFLEAATEAPSLAAFSRVEREGLLTARAHFALLITPPEGSHPKDAVARVSALARQYDSGVLEPAPRMTVRNVKLFIDGVITAPAMSGAMLAPYFVPPADGGAGAWIPGKSRGPDVYFPAPLLRALLIEIAAAGLEPHMHVDGDRAVHEALDGVQALRAAFPGKDVRVGLAHDEIVSPGDFPRYAQLNAIPVLSFQWEKPASDTVDNARDYLGPARYRYIEPAGFLQAAGARIAFGSDWPVDALDEWFALKVGITRTNAPQSLPKYAGRLSADPGLPRRIVLRAATMNSAYELHQDDVTGSIEVGKFADLIVVDRNLLTVLPEEIAATRVLQTVVGGKVVYEAEGFGPL